MTKLRGLRLLYVNGLRSRVANLNRRFPVLFTEARARWFVFIGEIVNFGFPVLTLPNLHRIQLLGHPWSAIVPAAASIAGLWIILAIFRAAAKLQHEFGLSRTLGMAQLLVDRREAFIALLVLGALSLRGSLIGAALMACLLALGLVLPTTVGLGAAVGTLGVMAASGWPWSPLLMGYVPQINFQHVVQFLGLSLLALAVWVFPIFAVRPACEAKRLAGINLGCLVLSATTTVVLQGFTVTERFAQYALPLTCFLWIFILRSMMIERSTPESWGYLLLYLRSIGVDGNRIWQENQAHFAPLLLAPYLATVVLAPTLGCPQALVPMPVLVAVEYVVNQTAIMDKTVVLPVSQREDLLRSSRAGVGAMVSAVIMFSAAGVLSAGTAVSILSTSGLQGLGLLGVATALLHVINRRNVTDWSCRINATH